MISKWLTLLLIAVSPLAFSQNLQRLDPHGDRNLDVRKVKSLKEHSECTTCHVSSSKGLTLKSNVGQICRNCHNASPHSGAKEHLGKTFQGHPVTCLSCHSPHRSESVDWESPSGYFNVRQPYLPPEHRMERAKNAMLQKTCTDCHRW